MAHLHKKVKKGRPYYYVREIKRIGGKPTVVSQVYLGSVERIAQRFQEAAQAQRPVRLRALEHGALLIAHELEKRLDTIGLIDRVVPRAAQEKGPTVGEYFFYAWANRLIAPRSKRQLADWYQQTAIARIRPVAVEALTSQRYWEKWERVTAEQVTEIGAAFFARVWQLQPVAPECLLFDTTNYYTYLASPTASDLSQRGHSKAGKHQLRQIGLALLVDRQTGLPLFYREYAGNVHDAKLFGQVIDELFGVMCGLGQTKQRLTVVFDKGMNNEPCLAQFDDQTRIHFVTTYSTYFAEELMATDLRRFTPLALARNERLVAAGEGADRMRAYRTRLELWGQPRTVVVTYNPRNCRKKQYTLARKLETVREALLDMRWHYREQTPQWRSATTIRERYLRLCERLHLGGQYYQLEFSRQAGGPELSFRKDHYQVARSEAHFGKTVIVTDNHDWTTEQIVQASLDRSVIEQQFRASKASEHVRMGPFYHWTDGKIRCHLLSCVIALTALRLLELEVAGHRPAAALPLSGRQILQQMQRLHEVWLWYPGKTTPAWVIETPTQTQAEVLQAFGYVIGEGGVLQSVNG